MRSELAATILAALGSPLDKTRQTTEQENILCAEEVLCERMKGMIAQLRDLGIANAKIARDLDIDPGAVSEIHTDGWTGRLGLESSWIFVCAKSTSSRTRLESRTLAQIGPKLCKAPRYSGPEFEYKIIDPGFPI
jgi:hypothetical protein